MQTFSCPLMSKEEYASVCVSMAELEHEEKGVRAVMQENGYCIIPDVLSAEKVKVLEQTMYEDLESLIDKAALAKTKSKEVKQAWQSIQEKGVRAWPSASLKKMGNKNRFQLRSLPHSPFAWDCRLDPNVRRVYEVLHGTKDLISSCDNSFVSGGAAPTETENKSWPHVDQNDNDSAVSGWDVYQGLLYIWSSMSPRSSTTVIWGKSHKPQIYQNYVQDPKLARRGAASMHFTSLLSMSESSLARDMMVQGWSENARRITVPAGGLLLWSSRTTHQGWSGGPRLAQPVCWEPVDRRTEETRYRKYALAALGFPSTHWASLGQPHYLVQQKPSPPVAAKKSSVTDNVVLPLRPYLKSAALVDGVDQETVWNTLGSIDLNKPFSEDIKTFLEHCIKKEFQEIL